MENKKYPPRRRDLAGKTFSRLTVIGFSHTNDQYAAFWKCKCICGKMRIVMAYALTSGHAKSCGCYKDDLLVARVRKHGMCEDRFYSVYKGMRGRCENPKHKAYSRYGGRGIKVLWKTFSEFKKDMFALYQVHLAAHGPKNTTIERIDNDGNYCRENCKWATRKEQSQNTALVKRAREKCQISNGKQPVLSATKDFA